MKTSVKRIKELDFSQPVVIDKISSTSAIVLMKYKSTKTAYPTWSEEDIWSKINEYVLKDCIFSKAMHMIIPCYEMTIGDDFQKYVEHVKKAYPVYATFPKDKLELVTKQMLLKDLIIDDLSKYWNIQASDSEAKMVYERMYRGGEGKVLVYEQLKKPETIRYAKSIIISDKTINKLISELKYSIDWESIEKYNKEFKEKIKQNKK